MDAIPYVVPQQAGTGRGAVPPTGAPPPQAEGGVGTSFAKVLHEAELAGPSSTPALARFARLLSTAGEESLLAEDRDRSALTILRAILAEASGQAAAVAVAPPPGMDVRPQDETEGLPVLLTILPASTAGAGSELRAVLSAGAGTPRQPTKPGGAASTIPVALTTGGGQRQPAQQRPNAPVTTGLSAMEQPPSTEHRAGTGIKPAPSHLPSGSIRLDEAPRGTVTRADGPPAGRGAEPSGQGAAAYRLDPSGSDDDSATSDERHQQRRGAGLRSLEPPLEGDPKQIGARDHAFDTLQRPTAPAAPTTHPIAAPPAQSSAPAPTAPPAAPPIQPVPAAVFTTGTEPGQANPVQAVHLEVHPADMGAVQLRVVLAHHTVHAHVTTEHADVGQFLAARQGQLESALNSSGLDMGQFRVQIDRQGYGQSHQDPSPQAAQDQAHQGRRGQAEDQPAEQHAGTHREGEAERRMHVVA